MRYTVPRTPKRKWPGYRETLGLFRMPRSMADVNNRCVSWFVFSNDEYASLGELREN
jgi:hypothetical protein